MGLTRTLRVLREDLNLSVPPLPDRLEEIDHPLLTKSNEQFADDETPHERIRSIDDQVLFKVKIGRWRGAAWACHDSPVPVWLVAAGHREDGSRNDFYAALTADAQAARAQYNATHTSPLATATFTAPLLPTEDDWQRYELEAGARLERRVAVTVHGLVRNSLGDGHEHAALLDGAALGVQVRALEDHETYVAIRIIGSVPDEVTATILESVPGCDRAAWGPEMEMPDRPLASGEQVWSNLMDPAEAAKVLDEEA